MILKAREMVEELLATHVSIQLACAAKEEAQKPRIEIRAINSVLLTAKTNSLHFHFPLFFLHRVPHPFPPRKDVQRNLHGSSPVRV